MEETFSRNDLLTWLNDLLKTNISKIEQLGTGSAYCLLFDQIYPGKLQTSKVNVKAKSEYEYTTNLKLLQQAFLKVDIQKPIEVNSFFFIRIHIFLKIEKLIKLKYQDNFDFLIFLKRLHEAALSKENSSIAFRQNSSISDFENPFELKSNTSKFSIQKNSNSKSKPPKPPVDSAQNPIFCSNFPSAELLSAERNFFFNKLRDIDHFLDVVNKENSIEDVVRNIREIIYNTPDKLIQINNDGTIKLEGATENILSENGFVNSLEKHLDFEDSMQIE